MAINHSVGFREGLSPAGKDAYTDLNLCSYMQMHFNYPTYICVWLTNDQHTRQAFK